jgi:hypothetical protein
MPSVTVPAPGQATPPPAGERDLDTLYPQELALAIDERLELVGRIGTLAHSPRLAKADPVGRASLESELVKLDRRLWLHNRRCRGAHMALAERLGRGWPERLSSLFAALGFVERLQRDLAPAFGRPGGDPGRDREAARGLADHLAAIFKSYAPDIGAPLGELVEDVSAPRISRHAGPAFGARPPAKSADASPAADPGPFDPSTLPPGQSGRAGRVPPDPGAAPSATRVRALAPNLLAQLNSLPSRAPKKRRALAEHVRRFDALLENFRKLFLVALLQAEEWVLAHRGKTPAGGPVLSPDDRAPAALAALAAPAAAPPVFPSAVRPGPACPASVAPGQIPAGVAAAGFVPADTAGPVSLDKPAGDAPPETAEAEETGGVSSKPSPGTSRDDSPADGSPDGSTADGPTADGPTADGSPADGPTADGPTADGPPADSPGEAAPPADDPVAHPADDPAEDPASALGEAPAAFPPPPRITPYSPWRPSRADRPAVLKLRRGMLFFTLALLLVAWFVWMSRNPGGPARIHVYNGLAAPVLITLNGRGHSVSAGGGLTLALPAGKETSLSAASRGLVIESFDELPRPAQGESLIYNVAGAGALLEWEAVYAAEPGDPPPRVTSLGAPTFATTRADFVFADPPRTIRLRGRDDRVRVAVSALGGHPARTLGQLPAGERTRVVEAQARWNIPGALWTPLWLDLLASRSPRAAEIMEERLLEFPGDPWTVGYLLKTAPAERLPELCRRYEAPAAANPPDGGPDAAYLATLCLPPEERSARLGELLKNFPDDPWLNRAAGWERYAQDDLEGALWYLDLAFETDPSILLPELDTLARLRKFSGEGPSSLAAEFGFWVPGLSALARRDPGRAGPGGDAPVPGGPAEAREDQAYVLLERRLFDEALAMAGTGTDEAARAAADRLLRLAGASRGAPRELVARALELPADRGLDRDTAWAMLGLALRENAPTGEYEAVILENSPARAAGMTEAVKDADAPGLARLLPGAEAWLQGQACAAAEVAGRGRLPEKCPPKARGFLFPGERPALGPAELAETPAR